MEQGQNRWVVGLGEEGWTLCERSGGWLSHEARRVIPVYGWADGSQVLRFESQHINCICLCWAPPPEVHLPGSEPGSVVFNPLTGRFGTPLGGPLSSVFRPEQMNKLDSRASSAILTFLAACGIELESADGDATGPRRYSVIHRSDGTTDVASWWFVSGGGFESVSQDDVELSVLLKNRPPCLLSFSELEQLVREQRGWTKAGFWVKSGSRHP